MATKPKATTAVKAAAKPTAAKLATAAAKPVVVATAAVSPADRIAELLADRDHLLELKSLTAAAPRAVVEARADIPKVIELLAGKVDPQTAWLAGPSGYADLARQLSQQDTEYAQIPAASLLAWMLPEAMAERIAQDLDDAYEQLPAPMPASQKAAELNRLGREIATVEAEISAVWWSANASGLQLDPPPIDGATLIGLAQ